MKVAIAPQDVRLPSDISKDIAVNSEVKVYKMSPEEIRAKYGPPLTELIPKETLFNLRKQGLTARQIAARLNLEPDQVRALIAYHSGVKFENFSFQEKEVKKVEIKTDEALTKERYLELKEQGVSDIKIVQAFKLTTNKLVRQKREWGLNGYRLPPAKKESTKQASAVWCAVDQ